MHACQLYTSAPGKSIPAPLPGTGTLHITYSGLGNCDILQELESQTSDPTYRKRLVSVYQGLSNEQALRLAAKHNMVTSLHHDMSTCDKVCINS